MIKFFGKTNIDFLGKRHIALTISGIAILIGLVSIVMHGGPNYSIDFKGGLQVILRITEPEGKPKLTENLARVSLSKIDLGNSEVKMSRSAEGEDLMIRVKEDIRYKPPEAVIRLSLESLPENLSWQVITPDKLAMENLPELTENTFVVLDTDISKSVLTTLLDSAAVDNPKVIQHKTVTGKQIWVLSGEGKDAVSRINKILAEDFPDYDIVIRSIDRVGPRMGAELRYQALMSIFAALGLIIIYLWWRFEFLFGIAAVIALFHDVLITLGIFSILDLEISIIIIGAFLTLVGYSLNDTIVVFDRIRENIRRYKDSDYSKIINRSINDNLSRTIVTSMTTLLVVLILLFFGGEVLHGFSIALMVGIIVGTYSSIYIASPILVEWAYRTGQTAGKRKIKD